MKKSWILISVFFFSGALALSAQVNYTANDQVRPYTEAFSYGANMGYFPPWKDEQLAEIAIGVPEKGLSGAGVTSLRPALFAHFLEYYGYDIRVPSFKYYESIGYQNNVVFVGYPSEAQRASVEHCPGHRSEMFANLYTDIWDDGANGTPVNDENHYALYLYKMVSLYKDYVKVWEIWNEPDFDYSGKAWKPKNIPDNWWEADPDPCDYAIRAPAYEYIRMLRISWEVIKTLDPDSYVAVGGLGFPSFMDVVLRNTDNPDEGKISKDYPLKGGAYFDLMSLHSYPHIDGSLRDWSDEVGGFVYERHSDEAVRGMLGRKEEFAEVLAKHGYDGKTYPEKVYIITECNIPRKAFSDFIGTEEAQRNFIIKALVACQKNAIEQFHIYNMAEVTSYEEAKNEYDLMGLFQKLKDVPPYQQQLNTVGASYRSTSEFLKAYAYDPSRTQALNLPKNVEGAAFKNDTGDFRYVLWAMTTQDQSEQAAANFSFPASWKIPGLQVQNWEHSSNKASRFIPDNTISLTGEPVFIQIGAKENLGQEILFNCGPNPFRDSLLLNVYLPQKETINLTVWDHQGKLIKTFVEQEKWKAGNHSFQLQQKLPAGIYICRLETKDRTLIRRILKTNQP